ncbi:class I SAM-dependent methyltransferase [Geomesophilobacter sediminis]|uniref:SAM-dependent methyltransferase n=1 Tax=Geomesophilobacter sediminis TaxID=2798584 RepID=A0A8J7IZ34_9BACT|nr:class I SAM-dependent methyltransferase [Geomesophilobacter sediminis]MBJ6725432.1 SAM-dependent methyltransferase [Geomesophilobacter sediminis]
MSSIRYEDAVPWGRSFDEYRRMFRLTDEDLGKKIIGAADGPASFNAVMKREGRHVVSCDPLYHCSGDDIRNRIEATYHSVLAQTAANQHLFEWDEIESPDALGELRMKAMQDFLSDYDQGRTEGRYVSGKLPALPFENGTFDLAICSHFLFLYSDNLPLHFHRKAVDELCRVAKELRIFPLLTYRGTPSPFAAPIVDYMRSRGYEVSVEEVPYRFQRGGNKMLRITRSHDC